MGGGVLFDLIHEIDLAINLIGEPEGKIYNLVNKASNLNINVEDLAELLYRTKKNIFVSIHLDYLSHGYRRYIEIIGEKGDLKVDFLFNKITVVSEGGISNEKLYNDFSRNDMYIDMLFSYIQCLKELKNSPLPLKEGLLSNRIAIDIRNKFLFELWVITINNNQTIVTKKLMN